MSSFLAEAERADNTIVEKQEREEESQAGADVFNESYFEKHGHDASSPLLHLGSGDSMLFLDVLPQDMADEAFSRIDSEVEWNVMYHKGSQVPRLIAIQGEMREEDGALPLYRHPADEQPTMSPFTSFTQRCKEVIESRLNQPLNHVLIQKYRSGHDNIGEHADKTLDILKGSAVVNLSFGASRVMTLKSKADFSCPKLENPTKDAQLKRWHQKITLPHNSIFVLGWQTNRDFLHSIRQNKRMSILKTASELAYEEQRISLTFRQIATYMDPKGNILGQGARKQSSQTHDVENNSSGISEDDLALQSRALLKAFSTENRSSKFDWDAQYGEGFDVINFSFINNANNNSNKVT